MELSVNLSWACGNNRPYFGCLTKNPLTLEQWNRFQTSFGLTLVGQIEMVNNVVPVSIGPSCLSWANREFATWIIWLSAKPPLRCSHLCNMMETLSCYLKILTLWLHFHFSMAVSLFESGPRACVMAPMWCVLAGRFDAVTHKPSAWGKRLCLLRCVRFLIPFPSRRTSPAFPLASVRLYLRHPQNTFRNSLTNRRRGGSVFDVCVRRHVWVWCCTG